MRSCPPNPSTLLRWDKFDQMVRVTLNKILGTSLDEQVWLQAQLPAHVGGLGLRNEECHQALKSCLHILTGMC